jgi:hypothetical protein
MRISSRSRLRFLLLFLPCALVLGMPSLAQDPDLAFQQIVGQPRGLPELPPQGAWGEIINATTRWIVIQNHSGQQYPISIEDIGEFLVRWPSSVDDLTANSWIEAVGPDLGSNILQTSHVDVFEGSDRTLVAPTYNRLLPNNSVVTTLDPGFNRLMNAWDYGGQMQLDGWAYPVSPGITGIPNRLHVVGNAVNRVPLRVGLPGGNFAEVIPGDAVQFTVSQVTRGSINYVRKGDYAYLMPLQINPRGVRLSQLVLYKSIPIRQFNPAVR